ncbi:hypothetical protein FACS1894199_17630 [Bacteroidia bacterium]|nr:hypothetical protein FACS1894199_17630 [Bacteroidia bacterium]
MKKIISITGDLGSGKSTVSALLCEQLKYDYIYTGDIQRQIAAKYKMTTTELNKYSETHPEIDEEIDAMFKSLSHSENLIVDSRLAWFFIPDSFAVYLKTDLLIAAERITNDTKRKSENYTSKEEAAQNITKRKASENKRYKELYGADCSNLCNFHCVVDTSHLTPQEVAEAIIAAYRVRQHQKSFSPITYNGLVEQIRKKNSFLCVGLDSDIDKIPAHLLQTEDPVFEFNRAIIDATASVTIAYKPNIAFYECRGVEGWKSLERTINYLNINYPEIFTIADAKRGDIGNTSQMYAKAFFETMNFDAITVAPYMGEDSVRPFLEYAGKWVILLALTSNKGAQDFQFFEEGSTKLYEKVLQKSQQWACMNQMMYVIGATKAEMLTEVRKQVPDHFLLVPGVGAQGGSLAEVAKYGMNSHCGIIVNSSRGIIYADNTENFAVRAGEEAQKLQREMKSLLEKIL